MVKKVGICVAFIAVLLCPVFAAGVVDTAEIDEVRRRTILNEQDQLTIETFVSQATQELLNTENPGDVASARVVLVSRSKSQQESAQIQYGPYFFSAVQKDLSNALQEVAQMPASKQKTIITLNMMILVNDLGNIELSKMALLKLKVDNENTTVRYWAVKAVTNAEIIAQLNSTENGQTGLAREYINLLKSVAKKETCPEITNLIATFAAQIKGSDATGLLEQIADARIAKYADWTVDNELLDMAVLKALFDSIASASLGRRFAQLSSYVIQRYLSAGDTLTEEQKQHLASVIVSSERLLKKMINAQVGNLQRSIEKNRPAILAEEHDALFGSDSAQGTLPLALGFDYGKKPDGSIRTAPLKLKPFVKTN